jgi:PAS domain-containing protein
MTGLAKDITERKLDDENLRRSEEFDRRILENNRDWIEVIDLDDRGYVKQILSISHDMTDRPRIRSLPRITNNATFRFIL